MTNVYWRHLALLVALFFLLLGWTYGRWDLWGSDEGRYVQVARELLPRDNWLLLTVHDQPYTEKTPLPFWIFAGMLKLGGGEVNVWWLRLPSILLALAAVLATYAIGQRRFGPRAGLLAALMLMTAPLFVEQAPTARLDALLTGAVTLALAVWLLRPGWDRPLEAAAISWRRAALFWALVIAAFFTKGPPALLFILAAPAWEALRLRSARPWRSIRPLPGLMASFGTVGAWLWSQRLLAGEEFVETQVARATFGRLLNVEHLEGPFYYLKGLAGEVFMPWTLLLIPALFVLWRNRKAKGADRTALRPIIGWIIIPLLVLHLALGKRQHYLLPLVPALALLTGWYCDRFFLAVQSRPLAARLFASLLLLIGGAAVLAAGVGYERPDLFWDSRIFLLHHHAVIVACAGLTVIAAAIMLLKRKTSLAVVAALFLAAYAVHLAELAAVYPARNPERSSKMLAMQVEAALGPNRNEVAAVEKAASSRYHVYGDYRVLDVFEDAEEAIASGKLPDVLVLLADDYHELDDEIVQAGYGEAASTLADGDSLVVAWRPEIEPNEALASNGELHVGLMGDSGTGGLGEQRLVRRMVDLSRSRHLDAVFLLGDNIYDDLPYPAALERRVVEPLHPLLDQRVPFFGVLGNHDVRRKEYRHGEIYDPLFRMEGREYYRQVLTNGQYAVSFFVLNSETLGDDPLQLEWLAKALAADTSDYHVLLLHRPLLGTVEHGGSGKIERLLRPILDDGPHIDAIFSGHNHVYERLVDKAGIHHVTLGSGGKLSRGIEFPEDPRREAQESGQRVLGWLTLDDDGLSFHAYGAHGEQIDSFEIPPLDTPPLSTRGKRPAADRPS
ncbi:MAG: Undecaprenyl phosphate-alpha-4-amino-4-deoxy-L-arabinose arabinosyl transferase [candidate division BRC1 bacterium ADurb.BinA292]|nr:MAG: Undecaprenyl phosphate-alpha-4-amino-4-deoxy-L-arabinose arabinosyl transferase [candidate division BRC1 bacterium ADurb.BinA292]